MTKKNKKVINQPQEVNKLNFFNELLNSLNTNKFFAGIIIILLNIGSKVINVQLSKSAEEYLKMSISQQILVFAMSWMGTRDIIASLILTFIFVIVSQYLLNEESMYCIIPKKYHILPTLNLDTNNDGEISEIELNNAINLLERAKNKKKNEDMHKNYLSFNTNLNNN
jgi:hypothetical protein